MRISPQFGQRNLVASDPGAIGLPQLVHVTNDSVDDFSDMELISLTFSKLTDFLISSMFVFASLLFRFLAYTLRDYFGSKPSGPSY